MTVPISPIMNQEDSVVAPSHNHKKKSVFFVILKQIKLLLWKRKKEITKSKWDVAKIIVPPMLFFTLIILIYYPFSFLSPAAVEPFIVPLAFWLFIVRIVVQIMYEKFNRLQEAMRMMGLLDSSYWISYFIFEGVLTGFIISFICTIFTVGGLFNDGNFGEILGLLFVFSLAAVPFAFFLCSFFDNPQVAGIATLCILLGVWVLYGVIFTFEAIKNYDRRSAEIICCFVPPIALQLGCASFQNSWPYHKANLSLSEICGILVADIFIYSILAWYFSQVWPSNIGVSKPWYFLFLKNYWFPQTNDSVPQAVPLVKDEVEEGNAYPLESVDESLLGQPTVSVNNLRKTYGSQVAVNNINFNMYENQIFALLGHNGAGKTTTISMLTGLTNPDYLSLSGSGATIYGNDLFKDMMSIRNYLGVCPQHDVLFESLTVKEHILFFAQLKGHTYEEAYAESSSLTTQFHLEKRMDHTGAELSGGQKRKLSVAIAVCGGSKFVVLDEPTAGMDPLARRELWDLLASLRHGRTMLLTTHYMDEADILGDRIGIMSLGVMQCLGSSQFLKTTYGSGYKLVIDKDPSMTAETLAQLTIYIQGFISEARYFEEDGAESLAQYMLPFSSVKDFGNFFAHLEQNFSHYQILNYGLVIVSLEDVFLKVGGDHSVEPVLESAGIIEGIGSNTNFKPNFLSQVIGITSRKLSIASNDINTLSLIGLPIAAIIAVAILYNKRVISKSTFINCLASSGIYAASYLGVPGLIAEFVVRERADKLRNVLTVMGCDFRAYWLGTFIADYLLLSIPTVIMFISWGGASMGTFSTNHQVGHTLTAPPFNYTSPDGNTTLITDFTYDRNTTHSSTLSFLVMIAFTLQIIAFSYFFTTVFTAPKATVTFMPLVVILLLITPNILLLIGTQIAKAFKKEIASGLQAGILLWGTMIFSPHGALFCAFLNTSADMSSFIKQFPDIGACLGFMFAESVVFLGLTYYIDIQSIASLPISSDPHFDPRVLDNLDPAVLAERQRTNEIAEVVPVKINEMRKVFAPTKAGKLPVVAVQNLSMTVDTGEIFGLLGANGAGKTTALSIITRLLSPTAGDALVMGESISTQFPQASKHIGVVTQSNSLWDLLSVEDHLYLFSRLRGVPSDKIKSVVEGTIDQLELTPHRKKLAGRLSGGMKRKLCVAIALIGDPEVVLLDEPSAGLDPVSRRNLWSVILRTMSQRSVILTTHSMEEAEALCKRIGIMVNGQMRVLGSKQQLKNQFGSGFELTAKLRVSDIAQQTIRLTEFVCSHFPSAIIIAENGGLITYRITKEEMKLSTAFSQIEKNKEKLDIENYSVMQPTLEQVFLETVKAFTNDTSSVIDGALLPENLVVVREKNQCGCTDLCILIMIIVSLLLFVILLGLGIALAVVLNSPASGLLSILGVISLIVSIIGCCLYTCLCRPKKGLDE
eukprot:gene14727-19795_t